eukprot:gene9396-biopygen19727
MYISCDGNGGTTEGFGCGGSVARAASIAGAIRMPFCRSLCRPFAARFAGHVAGEFAGHFLFSFAGRFAGSLAPG